MDIPANSPQDPQEKWQKIQEPHHTLYRPHLTCERIKFMTLQLEKDGTGMARLEELPEESISSLKQHGSTF